jgi:hypothetical protein
MLEKLRRVTAVILTQIEKQTTNNAKNENNKKELQTDQERI